MTNMSITYQRSCHSLTTLQQEIRVAYPGREQNKGFVTGYMDAARRGEYSGHYVDNNGTTFAYDIGVDIEGDGTGLIPSDAANLAEYLCTKMHPKFQYLIYNHRIRGNHTNWKWMTYTGTSPHKDHIHVSVQDVQWGESSGISPAVYDSTTPWGIHNTPKQPAPTNPGTAVNPTKTSGLIWTVDPGDTLNRIANYYGISPGAIAMHNNIKTPNNLSIGQVLQIPTGLYWTVEKGDTLNKIGAYYGIPAATIQNRNGLKNPNQIDVGQVLRIA